MILRINILLILICAFSSHYTKAQVKSKRPNFKSIGITVATPTQDFDFATIDYPSQIFGLRFATLNQKKTGLYYGLQLNKFALINSENQFNEQEQTHNFSKDLVFISTPHKHGKVNLDFGLTKKILPATWFYMGAGACFNRSFHTVSLFEDDGRFTETIEAENINPENQLTPSAEAGLMLNLRIFNLGLGVKSYNILAFDFNESFCNATVGITLKRKRQK